MSFFKEIDLAITEQAPEGKAQEWKHLANQHFEGSVSFKELPVELQEIITGIEQIYQNITDSISKEVYCG